MRIHESIRVAIVLLSDSRHGILAYYEIFRRTGEFHEDFPGFAIFTPVFASYAPGRQLAQYVRRRDDLRLRHRALHYPVEREGPESRVSLRPEDLLERVRAETADR